MNAPWNCILIIESVVVHDSLFFSLLRQVSHVWWRAGGCWCLSVCRWVGSALLCSIKLREQQDGEARGVDSTKSSQLFGEWGQAVMLGDGVLRYQPSPSCPCSCIWRCPYEPPCYQGGHPQLPVKDLRSDGCGRRKRLKGASSPLQASHSTRLASEGKHGAGVENGLAIMKAKQKQDAGSFSCG